MNDPLIKALAADQLTAEDRQALRELLDAEPGLRQALARWAALQGLIRQQLHTAIPDQRLLVLYALSTSAHAPVLSIEEQAAAAAAQAEIEEALQQHPGLQAVVEDIQRAAGTFEAEWQAAATRAPGEDRDRDTRTPASRAADRPAQPAVRQRRTSWQYVGWATAAVLVAASLLLLWPREPALSVAESIPGETTTVAFPDGSTALLVDAARITYRPGASFDRKVDARGAVYFTVTPRETPFRVATAAAEVRVLGTAFGVEASEEATEVVLATGQVAVTAAGQEVTLTAGERSRAVVGAPPSAPERVDISERLAWTGLLFFRETPMAVVAERLEARFGRTVEVAPPLADERVSGTFATDASLEEIVEALAATLGATAATEDQALLIKP